MCCFFILVPRQGGIGGFGTASNSIWSIQWVAIKGGARLWGTGCLGSCPMTDSRWSSEARPPSGCTISSTNTSESEFSALCCYTQYTIWINSNWHWFTFCVVSEQLLTGLKSCGGHFANLLYVFHSLPTHHHPTGEMYFLHIFHVRFWLYQAFWQLLYNFCII